MKYPERREVRKVSGLSRKKKAVIIGLVLIAFLSVTLATPVFAHVSEAITRVFVTNTNSNPVPVKHASSFKTYFDSYSFDSMGHIDLTGILSVRGFEKVSIMILEFPDTVPISAAVVMGKIKGATVASQIDSFTVPTGSPVPLKTYDVVGPDFSIVLFGQANTSVNIQAWVYMQ
jgi:hypothetical protein